jgi:hypothetical protein
MRSTSNPYLILTASHVDLVICYMNIMSSLFSYDKIILFSYVITFKGAVYKIDVHSPKERSADCLASYQKVPRNLYDLPP